MMKGVGGAEEEEERGCCCDVAHSWWLGRMPFFSLGPICSNFKDRGLLIGSLCGLEDSFVAQGYNRPIYVDMDKSQVKEPEFVQLLLHENCLSRLCLYVCSNL